ncbi:MAG: DUF3881 family protein [Lachnospiraceae bacterium]|nr:DUF3881 family protein [Lachnospiraceae bacterium]
MHQYLKAIGFSKIQTKKAETHLLDQVEDTFSHQTIVSYNTEADFCEYEKEFAENIGITVCGEMDESEFFEREYYFPYFRGKGITSYSDIVVERRIEKEMYVGVCEDVRIGISLIFHLQNGIEYMKELQLGTVETQATTVTLSGLALSGKILFPVMKNENQVKNKKEETENRMSLLSAARQGDQTAIETLTLDDIDIYSQVSRRLIKEDLFSIVDTYFMPYGVECDQYSILGEILDIKKVTNFITGVELYQMALNVNELHFDVCVPVSEVMGEPQVGRRFKATIWLQGFINF